jgi:hypothetical protein
MQKIKVDELCGRYYLTVEDGLKLYEKVYPLLAAGELVEMDFSRVDVVASGSISQSFARWSEDFDADYLDKHLKVVGLSPYIADAINYIVESWKTIRIDSSYTKKVKS